MDDWRARARATLEQVYGVDSDETDRDVSRIRFDDSPVGDAAERLLRQEAEESEVHLPPIPLPAQENTLRRGLREAAELIRSLLL